MQTNERFSFLRLQASMDCPLEFTTDRRFRADPRIGPRPVDARSAGAHGGRMVLGVLPAAMMLALFLGVPSYVAAADLYGGTVAQFQNKPGDRKDKMRVVFAEDGGIAAPLPSPTRNAAFLTVRVETTDGIAETVVDHVRLAGSLWREKFPGEYYVYKDRDLRAAGVSKMEFWSSARGGGLSIKAKGGAYGARPVRGPVRAVEVTVSVGTSLYCGRFSPETAREKRNDATRVHFVRGSGRCTLDGAPSTTSTTSTTTTMVSTSTTVTTTLPSGGGIRVPAEWEEQEAVWLQWPGPYEKTYEPAFAEISGIISSYQKLHILYDNNTIRGQARQAIGQAGHDPDHPNIRWHHIANDNAWMRDNGPTYVVQDGELRIQDWRFDAWGGGFGNNIPYHNDDNVPLHVAPLVNMPVDRVEIVHERGNLEFNGSDAVILNWSVIGDPERNPGYTREQAVADMKRYFGVTRVVLIEGYVPTDFTRGHIDGIARFIGPDTVVVAQCTQASVCKPGDSEATIYDDAAQLIEDAGFEVIREPFEGRARYNGGPWFNIDYMNWLVGNGFVIAVGFENPTADAAARQRLQTYYPGRDVYVVDMLASWDAGGGAHCHTNDQPAATTAFGYTPWSP